MMLFHAIEIGPAIHMHLAWIGTGWGLVGGAAIGALGNIFGSQTQAGAQEQAAQTQQNMFNTIVGQEQPFLQGGYSSLTALNKLLGTEKGGFGGLPNGYLTQPFNPTMAQLEKYPGYQFQLQQGNLALNSANAPSVGAASGPALKSLMSFNQGLAGTNYQNYFNQYQTQQTNIFNRLAQIAGLGQSAAGNLGYPSAALGTGIAGAQAAAGGSLAGGIVGATGGFANNAVPLGYLLGNQNQGSFAPGYEPGGAVISPPGGLVQAPQAA